eukprot:5455619-Pyramimonas_sp.AAC.2
MGLAAKRLRARSGCGIWCPGLLATGYWLGNGLQSEGPQHSRSSPSQGFLTVKLSKVLFARGGVLDTFGSAAAKVEAS